MGQEECGGHGARVGCGAWGIWGMGGMGRGAVGSGTRTVATRGYTGQLYGNMRIKNAALLYGMCHLQQSNKAWKTIINHGQLLNVDLFGY